MRRLLLATTCILSALCWAQEDGPLEVVSVEKIWDAGDHNAFTDLIRFQDTWYCTFRESEAHVGGDGKIRVITSADGVGWESAGLLSEEGIDLRDPKLSVTPDGRLMVVCGGSVYQGGKELLGRQPRVAFSADGTTWSAPERVLGEGDWLWRVTWHKGKAYGTSYTVNDGPEDAWRVRLVVSDDGIHYEDITTFEVKDRPNECTLRFLDDDTMVAFLRRESGNKMAFIGTSAPPYTEWSWHESGYQVGGPNFIVLPDGTMWAAGRYYPGGAKTVIARFGPETYEPVLTLPSGGDTSYPGMVWHEGMLWVSYYSSHEGKTSIYLAKVRVRG